MTFGSGTTSNNDMLCLNIAIADDDAYEENELFTFLITSASPTSAVAIGASQAVKTIQDNNGIIVIVFVVLNFTPHIYCITDAVVEFEMASYEVNEEALNFVICIDTGITAGFQTDLVISITATDGKAGKSV